MGNLLHVVYIICICVVVCHQAVEFDIMSIVLIIGHNCFQKPIPMPNGLPSWGTANIRYQSSLIMEWDMKEILGGLMTEVAKR